MSTPGEKLKNLIEAFQQQQEEFCRLQSSICREESELEYHAQKTTQMRKVCQNLEEQRHTLSKELESLLETEKTLLVEIDRDNDQKKSLYLEIVNKESEAKKISDDITRELVNHSNHSMQIKAELKKLQDDLRGYLWS